MINELVFVLSLAVSLLGVHLSYRFFGKYGVFGWVAFAVILANIEVLGIVPMFGITASLGNALFGTIYLATDILNEVSGEKTAKRAVWIGMFCLGFFLVLTQIDLLYNYSGDDFAHDAFETIFGLVPRICLGSIIAFLIGNFLDVRLYAWLKERHQGRHMWFRNNICTITVQLIDNLILFFIAYYGELPVHLLLEMSFTAWIIEIIVALCDTPILYLTKRYGTLCKEETTA